MKNHVKFKDYNYSIMRLDQLSKEQLLKVEGGAFLEDKLFKIIVSPPGFVAPAIFE